MNTNTPSSTTSVPVAADYEAPQLTMVGDASDVVLGVAVGGFDGIFQMTEAGFEFELDEPA